MTVLIRPEIACVHSHSQSIESITFQRVSSERSTTVAFQLKHFFIHRHQSMQVKQYECMNTLALCVQHIEISACVLSVQQRHQAIRLHFATHSLHHLRSFRIYNIQMNTQTQTRTHTQTNINMHKSTSFNSLEIRRTV